MRENFNDNLNHIELITRTNPIKNLSADDYNKLPMSIKQAIEFIYDFMVPENKVCTTCRHYNQFNTYRKCTSDNLCVDKDRYQERVLK